MAFGDMRKRMQLKTGAVVTFTVWGDLQPLPQFATLDGSSITRTFTHQFRMHYLSGVTTAMTGNLITETPNRTFNIVDIQRLDETKDEMTLILKETT